MKTMHCRQVFEDAHRSYRKQQIWVAIILTPLLSFLVMGVAYFKFGDRYIFYLFPLYLVLMMIYTTYRTGFKVTGDILTRTARSLELTDENTLVAHTWPWFKQSARSIPLTSASLRAYKKGTQDFLSQKQQPVFLVMAEGLEVIIFETAFNNQVNVGDLFQKLSEFDSSHA